MLFSAALCSTLPPCHSTARSANYEATASEKTEELLEDHLHPYQIEFFILNCNALASGPWSPGTSAGREPNPEAGFWPGCCWSSAITMEGWRGSFNKQAASPAVHCTGPTAAGAAQSARTARWIQHRAWLQTLRSDHRGAHNKTKNKKTPGSAKGISQRFLRYLK